MTRAPAAPGALADYLGPRGSRRRAARRSPGAGHDKPRAATAETVNADGMAHRGLGATALRGIDKVTTGPFLFALRTTPPPRRPLRLNATAASPPQ